MPLLGWIILTFAIAVLLAAFHGVKSAYRSIRGRYRDKRSLARDFAAAGVAPRAATTGKRVGMAVAATVTGPGVTWRALLDGLALGWRAGKRWTAVRRSRRRRRRAGTTRPAATTSTPPDKTKIPPPKAKPQTCIRAGCGNPCWTPPGGASFRVCLDHMPKRAAPTAPAPPTKGTAVPIETKTSGELHTKEQFENELNATIKEAAAELEAAKTDLDAATEDVGRVDNMVASLTRCEIDVATRGEVMTLAGTNATTQAAHRSRVAAAEQRHAAAEKALQTFKNAAQTKFHANAS